jgi:ECF transporter S component (folate family)
MRSRRPLVLTAIMAGLSVVLTRFASLRVAIAGVEGIRLGLGSLPNILVGIIAGPLYGAASGAISDVIGFLLSPLGGGYMPHFTLTAALSGAIPGLVFRLLSRRQSRNRVPSVWVVGISVGVSALVVSLGLTPYFLHTLFGLPYPALYPARAAAAAIEIPAYSILIRAVLARYGDWERPGKLR